VKTIYDLEREIGSQALLDEILKLLSERNVTVYGIQLSPQNILKIRSKLQEYNIDLSEF
jgi:hypothetical protein